MIELPEGAELVRIGVPEMGEVFVTSYDGGPPVIVQDVIQRHDPFVPIVRPAKGWKFEPSFDVREYVRYYRPVRLDPAA